MDGYGGGVQRIAIAGGIGSGKSTVTQYLSRQGFVCVDADEVARALSAPGAPIWQALRDAFGDGILDATGNLDRAFVATIAFSNPSNLARLNAVSHGPIGEEMKRQLDACDRSVAFAALPLFRSEHRSLLALTEVWSVQVPPEVALERLVHARGLTIADAEARLAAQMTNDERSQLADVVVWNTGSVADLEGQIAALLAQRGFVRG